MIALLSVAHRSWFPVHGPRRDCPGTLGQVSCSEMENALSFGMVTKWRYPSQAVFSDRTSDRDFGSSCWLHYAARFECLSFDPFALLCNGFVTSKVNVRRRDVVQALSHYGSILKTL